MKKSELEGMSHKQLLKLISDAQSLQQERKAQTLQSLREKWMKEAEEEGFSVNQVLGIVETDFRRAKARRDGQRTPARIKYRDPVNPDNTWTGKGRTPTWMQPYIDQGKTKDDFLIKTA